MLNIDDGKKLYAKKPHGKKLMPSIITDSSPINAGYFLYIGETLALANKNNNLLHNSIDGFVNKYFDASAFKSELVQKIPSQEKIFYHNFDAGYDESSIFPHDSDNPLRMDHVGVKNDYYSPQLIKELTLLLGDVQNQSRFYENERLKFNQTVHNIDKSTERLYEHIRKINKIHAYLDKNGTLDDVDNHDVKKLSFGLAMGICGVLGLTAIFILPAPYSYISAFATLGPISAAILRLKSMK